MPFIYSRSRSSPIRGFSKNQNVGCKYPTISRAALTNLSALAKSLGRDVMARLNSVHGGQQETTSKYWGSKTFQYCHTAMSATMDGFLLGSKSTDTTSYPKFLKTSPTDPVPEKRSNIRNVLGGLGTINCRAKRLAGLLAWGGSTKGVSTRVAAATSLRGI